MEERNYTIAFMDIFDESEFSLNSKMVSDLESFYGGHDIAVLYNQINIKSRYLFDSLSKALERNEEFFEELLNLANEMITGEVHIKKEEVPELDEKTEKEIIEEIEAAVVKGKKIGGVKGRALVMQKVIKNKVNHPIHIDTYKEYIKEKGYLKHENWQVQTN